MGDIVTKEIILFMVIWLILLGVFLSLLIDWMEDKGKRKGKKIAVMAWGVTFLVVTIILMGMYGYSK